MKNSKELAKLLRAMATPTRVAILQILATGERCPSDLSGVAEITKSALSCNLHALLNAGLVKARRDGKWVHYSMNEETIRGIRELFSQNLLAENNEFHRFPR